MRRVIASYKGPVKGLRPYLLSLIYDNVIPFKQKKPPRKGGQTKNIPLILV